MREIRVKDIESLRERDPGDNVIVGAHEDPFCNAKEALQSGQALLLAPSCTCSSNTTS
jgi:hypothetical protein